MARTKVIDDFTAGQTKNIEQNAGVSNIFIANTAAVEVKASVRISISGEGTAYVVKDAKIPVGTTLKVLDNQLLQLQSSKIGVLTDTTGGIEVIYTAL